MADLFDPVNLGALALTNRVVMAPMTRSRADERDCPTELHVAYYSQRAAAGLIVSEGIQPSLEGKGYARTPGLHSDEQVTAWRAVTDAVHAAGGRMVAQLMHVGRIAAAANRPALTRIVAPSAIAAQAQVWTATGMDPTELPEALTAAGIAGVIQDYVHAARNAVAAGFDGIELHCSSGYLPAQFMATGTNQRTDEYGGSAQNRVRFPVETVRAIADAIGADRVGFRICPGNPFNDLHDDDPYQTHAALLNALTPLGLAYCHIIEVTTPQGIPHRDLIEKHWGGSLIINEGLDRERAEALLASGAADAVAFGRPFIGNPDLVERLRNGHPLAEFDPNTLYAPGPAGYTDYPVWEE